LEGLVTSDFNGSLRLKSKARSALNDIVPKNICVFFLISLWPEVLKDGRISPINVPVIFKGNEHQEQQTVQYRAPRPCARRCDSRLMISDCQP
jgi:hypothetical protein